MNKLRLISIISMLALTVTAQAQDEWEEAGDSSWGDDEEAAAPEESAEAEPIEEETPEKESSWLDNLDVHFFADAYYMKDWTDPNDVVDTQAAGWRAYANRNGFSVSFLGLDLAYATDKVGITTSLRFGPSVRPLMGDGSSTTVLTGEVNPDGSVSNVSQADVNSYGDLGHEYLKQAYVTWTPMDSLSIDFGQFDTIYGAEVAESWNNLNYTRGAVYFALQPFFHTGIRAAYTINSKMSVTGLLTNGGYALVESDNLSPAFGLQFNYAASDAFNMFLGYMIDARDGEGDTELDDKANHLVDLVINSGFGDLSLVFNGDLRYDESENLAYGLSLALGYSISEKFGAALRGELLGEPDGGYLGIGEDGVLVTGTLTLDYKAAPGLYIRLDNRIEYASEEVFSTGVTDSSGSKIWGSTVLGVAVTTGG